MSIANIQNLCNRFKTHPNTTSDLLPSTSATVETVATSSAYIVSSRQGSVDGAMQKCGICSLLSRLLRRAMCVGSRRGSGESYYQELAETVNSFGIQDATTTKTTDGAIYISLAASTTHEKEDQRENIKTGTDIKAVMEQHRPLLEALLDEEKNEYVKKRQLNHGQFLTMHKRRRKKLTTRALAQNSAILDDILHGQVQCVLTQASNWRFNAFTLETVTGGRSLPVLCVHLFHWYGLLDHFNLDVVRLWKLFTLIEEGYHSTNPYHNSIHATDVTQAMHCFLQERKIFENMEPTEILSSLLGAVTHDLDHPGVNQPFLIATSNHLAALYENTSVLENHHWRSAVGCLLESGVAEQIQDIRPIVEKQIASLILATDITRQTEFLAKFRQYLDEDMFDMKIAENRHFILQISLKCADISNPCRQWDISKKWSQKVCEEFFRQGDYERQLNLPVTSLCDRFSTSVPKIQVGFFKYVVTPLFHEWHRFLKTDLSTKMMAHLKENEVQWEKRLSAEIAEETKTEISDDELLDEDIDDEELADICIDLSDSSEVLLPQIQLPRRSSLQVPSFGTARFQRRHSVPNNPPKIIVSSKKDISRLPIRESIEMKFDDTFSLLSSDSDSALRKSGGGSIIEYERPLSSETILPELNIATMSSTDCADRLHIIMHGGISSPCGIQSENTVAKQLIRQQTFPPLQPYVRTRYLSATAEMSGCAQQFPKISTSPDYQMENINPKSSSKNIIKDGTKREQIFYRSETPNKIPKLTIMGQKENLDPTKKKGSSYMRRGSVPVDMLSKASIEDQFSSYLKKCDQFIRRSSVPVEVFQLPSNESQSGESQAAVGTSKLNTFQRRGSIPFDNISRANCNGNKSRNRKKILKRRSSGGPEILSPISAEPESGCLSQPWYRFKRTDRQKSDVESLLTRRRGSLPVEVLAACHTGTLRH